MLIFSLCTQFKDGSFTLTELFTEVERQKRILGGVVYDYCVTHYSAVFHASNPDPY